MLPFRQKKKKIAIISEAFKRVGFAYFSCYHYHKGGGEGLEDLKFDWIFSK